MFAMLSWCVIAGELVSLHEVYARKILVSKVDIRQVLAWNVQKLWQACSKCYIKSIKALLKQFVGIGYTTHHRVVLKLYSKLLKRIDLSLHNSFRQTKLGDTISEYPATSKERLKDGHIKAVAG